jgi:hypothetical protein
MFFIFFLLDFLIFFFPMGNQEACLFVPFASYVLFFFLFVLFFVFYLFLFILCLGGVLFFFFLRFTLAPVVTMAVTEATAMPATGAWAAALAAAAAGKQQQRSL